MFSKFFLFFNKQKFKLTPASVQVYDPCHLTKVTFARKQHGISRSDIDNHALKVLYRLKEFGYQGLLVGGSVRDLLLGKYPKDFDVATNATPDEIKILFKNCRLVGRRFRLAHILFGRKVIEVATFRGHANCSNKTKTVTSTNNKGMLLRDNVYGTLEEDAQRRDFTINALYYDINSLSVIDFTGGMQDIKQNRLKLIGNPEVRYREDPVRMLRAIRFSAKLDMVIAPETAQPITHLAYLLHEVSAARLFDESLKLLQSGKGVNAYHLLMKYKIFLVLFPQLTSCLQNKQCKRYSSTQQFIITALANTDTRIAQGQRITPAFLFAALLWPVVQQTMLSLMGQGLPAHDALHQAGNKIISSQVRYIAIPKRFTCAMRDIWQLQLRLVKCLAGRVYSCFEHPRFRAAYDFLLLRAEIEMGNLVTLAKWWTVFQSQNIDSQKIMIQQLAAQKSHKK